MSALKSLLSEFGQQFDHKLDAVSKKSVVGARKGSGKSGGSSNYQNNAPSTEEIDRITQVRRDQDEQLITRTLRTTFDSLNAVDKDKVSSYFRSAFGDRIAIDEEDGTPVFHESADKKVPLAEYLASWVRSSDGEIFVRPPKGTGPVGARWASTGSIGQMGQSELRGMDLDELMSMRIEDPVSFYQYAAKYPEEFHQKRQKWERRAARGLPPVQPIPMK